MMARDVVAAATRLDMSITPEHNVADVLLREGIAYDELSRFCYLGSWRAQGLGQWSQGDVLEAQGRLWLDGFLVGLRIGRDGV